MTSVQSGAHTLSRFPGYQVTVGSDGVVDVVSPVPGSSFSCLVSDLPYLLLCERQRADELADEVERLRSERP